MANEIPSPGFCGLQNMWLDKGMRGWEVGLYIVNTGLSPSNGLRWKVVDGPKLCFKDKCYGGCLG